MRGSAAKHPIIWVRLEIVQDPVDLTLGPGRTPHFWSIRSDTTDSE